jgi:hypothetical protein
VTVSSPRRKRSRGARPRGSNPHRPTQAQTLARQKQIVVDRDGRSLTWAEIATKHGVGEKEARHAYERFKTEIAPIISEESIEAREYLRMIERARGRLLKVPTAASCVR